MRCPPEGQAFAGLNLCGAKEDLSLVRLKACPSVLGLSMDCVEA
jgi:hypothetical protein